MKPTTMELLIQWMVNHPGVAEWTLIGVFMGLFFMLLLDLLIPFKTFQKNEN